MKKSKEIRTEYRLIGKNGRFRVVSEEYFMSIAPANYHESQEWNTIIGGGMGWTYTIGGPELAA